MKSRCIMALILVLLPASISAGVGIGAAVFSDTPILAAEDVSDALDGTFTFGANGRIKFDRLNLDALALYAMEERSIDLYLTAQLSYDFLIFRLSGGIGPALRFALSESSPVDEMTIDWLNAKFDLDLLLGRISTGLSFQYLVPSRNDRAVDFSSARGRIGASLILW
ncbi:hypothetical protein [Spirochaeta dissipatitropha]